MVSNFYMLLQGYKGHKRRVISLLSCYMRPELSREGSALTARLRAAAAIGRGGTAERQERSAARRFPGHIIFEERADALQVANKWRSRDTTVTSTHTPTPTPTLIHWPAPSLDLFDDTHYQDKCRNKPSLDLFDDTHYQDKCRGRDLRDCDGGGRFLDWVA